MNSHAVGMLIYAFAISKSFTFFKYEKTRKKFTQEILESEKFVFFSNKWLIWNERSQKFRMVTIRGRHWDPNPMGSQTGIPSPNPKVLGLGLGLWSIFQNFGIGNGIGIDFPKVWDWAWDYKFRTKSQEIPKVIIEI